MKNIIIGLSIFVASVNATDYCWAEEAGYPCCPDGYDIVEVEEVWGKWGIYNGMWCGILDKRDRCWAQAVYEDYTFCKYGTEILESNMDGDWGWDDENSTLCGMRNSPQRWNDRELVEETREEWEKFKVNWDNDLKYDFTRLSVFVGEDESKLNFGWYSTKKETPTICWGTTESLINCKLFTGEVQKYYILKGTQYYSNKVTVTGIKRNSVYYYSRIMDGKMDEIHTFKTYDEDNFNFIFVGDPQIGGSYGRITSSNNYTQLLNEEEGTRNDAFNWNRTVYNSMEFARTPSVFLSAGDQADEQNFFLNTIESFVSDNEDAFFNQETQYSAFLLPEKLKTIPVAAALGNHESYNESFRHHFNTPNPYTTSSNQFDSIIPAYNYFFKYNNVLVVVLESNYALCMDYITVIERAISTYPDLDWRIALFHHDLYGNGEYHSMDYHIVDELRPCLTGLLYAYGFDLAINGHDHTYSASKFIIYDPLDLYHTSEELKSNEVYRNPPGTLYITANCSTASKLYGFIYYEPDYINYYNQSYTSTFGTLDFQKENGKVRLTVTTYEVEGYKVIDGPYTIEKDANSRCWANLYGYKCCKEGTLATKLDEEGRYWSNAEGAGEDDYCGIITDPKEKCWSKPFGIDCCPSNTATYKTDENGSWGIEIKNGKSVMCGIIEQEELLDVTTNDTTEIETEIETEITTDAIEIETNINTDTESIITTDVIKPSVPTKTTTSTTTITTGTDDIETLYPIEIETETEIEFITITGVTSDTSHSSTIITTTSATTITTNLNSISETITTTTSTTTTTTKILSTNVTNCWATALGFPCCTNPNAQTYFIDENGYWSIENNDWCGKIILDNCWSLQYGYPCCTNQAQVPIIIDDDNSKWGIQNGDWCGLH